MGQYKVKNYAPKNYVESEVSKRIRKYGYDVSDVNENYIAQYQNDVNQYLKDYENHANVYGSDARKADDEYNSRAVELRTRAKRIETYLRQNKTQMSDKTYSELSGYLESTNKLISNVNKSSWQRASINSRYASQSDYNIDIMNGLSGMDDDSTDARKSAYDYSVKRIEELEDLIKEEKDKDKKKSLKEEKKKLKAAKTEYERMTKVYDDYSGFKNEDDYEEASKKRDYKNTRFEDAYDKGTGKFKGEYSIDDPLGFFKSGDGVGLKLPSAPMTGGIRQFLDFYQQAEYGDYFKYWNKGVEENWDKLLEEEEKMYYYILSKQGKNQALEYLTKLSPQLGKRQNEDFYDSVKQSTTGSKIALNVASVPANLLGGFSDLETNIYDLVKTGDINPYSSGHAISNFSQAVRGVTTDEINEKTNGWSFLGFGAGDLYQTAMSMADSAVTAAIGDGGLVLLGMNAAGNKAKELWEQGASANQIVLLSTVAGAAEIITEKVSLDSLIKNFSSAEGIKQLLLTTLKQAGVEASEEVASSLINVAADSIVRGINSDYGRNIQKYIDEGFDEKKAKQKAFQEYVRDDLWKSALSGFISGGLMGGGSNVVSALEGTYQTNQNGKNIIRNNGTTSLYSLAMEKVQNENIGKGLSKDIKKTAERVFESEKPRDVGRLSNLVDKAEAKISGNEIRSTLEGAGYGKYKAKELSDVIFKSITGQRLSEEESKELQKALNSKDEQKQKIVSSLVEGTSETTSKVLDRVSNDEFRRNESEFNVLKKIVDETGKLSQAESTNEPFYPEKAPEMTFDNKESAKYAVNEKTEDVLDKKTGEKIEISNISGVDIKNKDLVLKLKDGNTIKASDVSFSNNDEAYLYSSIAEMGVSVEAANMIATGYDSSVPILSYTNGMKEAYIYGYNHYSVKDLPKNTFLSDLPENLKARGLEAGRIDSIKAQKQAEKRKAKSVKAKKKTSQKGVYANNTKGKDKTLDLFYKALAEKTGVDIDKVDTINKGRANASYITNAVKICIASNANNEFTDTTHELGHFVSAWSNEKYQDVSNAIFNWYIDKFGYADYADAIDHFKTREGLNYSDAVEEFTNECIAGLFVKDGGAEDFVEWLTESSGYTKTEQKTILQKLVDMLKDIIDTLKDVIKNGKLSVTAEKSVQMEAEKAQEIRKMFLEAIDKASENSNKKTATDGGVKFESKIKYSLSENASDDVKRILSDRSYEGEVKLRDNTPEIMLSQKGVKDLPMVMKASHIRENIFTESKAKSFGLKVDKNINYHGLGEELFLKIIDGLDSVTEAYRGTSNAENPSRRTNYFLLISSVEDSNGNKINVPVYINETSLYNRVFIDSNKIATVFGRKNLYDFLKKQVNSGNLVRVKKQSGKTSESKAPIARDYSNSAYSDSISQNSENVNNRNEKFSSKDDEYLKLAEKPEENKAKLQQMVDEAAREAMPNSMVVDENGDLLAVYHGTSEDFTVFDKTKGRANMDIQGMFFSPWEIDAGGYGEKTGKYYLNIVNPAPESVGYKALNKFKGQNNAGIKAREYLESLGYDGVNNANEEYIAFNSNQIKSADPVTYDNDGNVIPLSERFNEDEVDIRYSIKSDKPYNDYSKALTSDEWKKYNNAMITGVDAGLRINDHSMLVECEKGDYSYKLVIYDNTFEEKPIRAVYGIGNDSYSETTIHEVAKYITGMEDNGYGRSFIIKRLSHYAKVHGVILGTYSGQNSRFTKYRGQKSVRESNNASRGNTQRQSNGGTVPQGTEKNGSYSRKDITDVDVSSIVDTSSPRYILSEALKGTTLNDAERAKIEEYQANIERLNEQENKLHELKSQIKDISFSSGKRDMQKLRKLKEEATKTENRISLYDKKLTRIESMKPIQQVIEREKSLVRTREKQKAKEGIQKYRERSAAREQQIREQYRESRQKAKIRREETGYRGRIRKIRTELEKELLRPTDTSYIPHNLASSMVDVCRLISFDTDNNSKAQAKRDEIYIALLNLKNHYDLLEKSEDADLESEFESNISKYIRDLANEVENTRVADMNLLQLRSVHDILTEINETLKDARRQIGLEEYITNAERGISIIEEQQKLKGVTNKKEELFNKYADYSLNTMRAVRRMVNYNENSELYKLFIELNDGVRKSDIFTMNAYKMFEPLTTGTNRQQYNDAINKVVDFGDGIKMTKMMAMQYILTWEREEHSHGTLSHLMASGAYLADISLLSKGKYQEAFDGIHSKSVHLSADQVGLLTSKLNSWDNQYLDVARNFFNEYAKNAINETTRVLKHRDIATSDYYIPYTIDPNSLVSEIDDTNAIMSTISGMGMLKSTVKNAKQSLLFTGLNNVIEKHISDVAKIYGLAIPIRNFNKVWTFRTDVNNTVKRSVGERWGKQGQQLIEQAIKDLQGKRPGDTDAIWQNIQNAFVTSSLNYNISVAMKQAASLMVVNNALMGRYYTAPELVARFFATASQYDKLIAEIDEHTGAHWRRRQGLSTQELGDMRSTKSTLSQFIDKVPMPLNGMKWIQYVDCVTTATFWKIAKEDVLNVNPNINVESDEYWNLVTETYNRIIEETQPEYDVLHRPEALKTQSNMRYVFATFKTQPLQNAGMLYDSYGEWKATGSKSARNKFYKTVASQMSAAIVFSIMTCAAKAIQHNLGKYGGEDDEDKAASFLKRIGFDSFENLAGILIPIGGSQLFDLVEAAVNAHNDEGFFSQDDIFNIPAVEFVSKIVSDFTKLYDENSWSSKEKGIGTLGNVLTDAAHLFGIPAKNIKNLVHGIIDNVKDVINGEYTGFDSGQTDATPNVYKLVSKGQNYDDAFNTVVAYFVSEGKSKSEAENSARGQFVTGVGNGYVEGSIDEEEAREHLQNVGFDENQIESKIKEWDFKIKYGFTYSNIDEEYRKGTIDRQTMIDIIAETEEVERNTAETIAEYFEYKTDADSPLSKQQYIKWYKEIKDSGITVDIYSEYVDKASNCKGTDLDGDGKTDSGSVKVEKLEVIDSLPISSEQKDVLYHLNGWAESKIYEAPWH